MHATKNAKTDDQSPHRHFQIYVPRLDHIMPRTHVQQSKMYTSIYLSLYSFLLVHAASTSLTHVFGSTRLNPIRIRRFLPKTIRWHSAPIQVKRVPLKSLSPSSVHHVQFVSNAAEPVHRPPRALLLASPPTAFRVANTTKVSRFSIS